VNCQAYPSELTFSKGGSPSSEKYGSENETFEEGYL